MPPHDNASAHPAAEYDAQIVKTLPYYAAFHEETFQLIEAVHGAPRLWLDTGCGTGTLVAKALPRFASTRFLLADPSAAMLERARVKLAGPTDERVTFLGAMGSQELPLDPTRRPDVITAIQCHHYFDREGRRSATRRCYECLAPGGLFVTFENMRPSSPRAEEIGRERWFRHQLRAGKPEAAARAHTDRFDVEFFPITVAEHLDLLRACGFTTVEILWCSCVQVGLYALKE